MKEFQGRCLHVGDIVALLNLFGRRLATVTEVSHAGFAVGRRQYHWDGRGRNHCESVAVAPLPGELSPFTSEFTAPAAKLSA